MFYFYCMNGLGELRNLTVQYVKETQEILEFRSKLDL